MKKIVFNRGVVSHDAPALTGEQDTQMTKALRRIASGCVTQDEIKNMRDDSPLAGWKSYKPSAALRHVCDQDWRIVFRETDSSIEVLAVGSRDDVYSHAIKRV